MYIYIHISILFGTYVKGEYIIRIPPYSLMLKRTRLKQEMTF